MRSKLLSHSHKSAPKARRKHAQAQEYGYFTLLLDTIIK